MINQRRHLSCRLNVVCDKLAEVGTTLYSYNMLDILYNRGKLDGLVLHDQKYLFSVFVCCPELFAGYVVSRSSAFSSQLTAESLIDLLIPYALTTHQVLS